MSQPVAVVLGLRENGLGMVRALGRQGVPVIAIDDKRHPVYARTRYARLVVCDDFHGAGLIDTLRDLGAELGQGGGIVIPTMDQNVTLLSRHRDRIVGAYRHSLPDAGVVEVLMDKGATRKFAESHGFLMPRSFEPTTEDELEAGLAQLEPPFIVKPQSKTAAFFRYAPKKVYFTRSRDEVRRAFRIMLQWEHGAVLQEWIPGPDRNLVFALYYFDDHGNPLGTFMGRKTRQYIPYCGTACSAEPWTDDTLAREGLRFFREIGYRGFGAIEFKIGERDGKYYLVEPSIGRTEHLFALAAANGVNLPYIGYRHMAGMPVPEPRKPRRAVRYVNWKNDFKTARTYMRDRELTVTEWLRSLRGPKQYAVFAWDDPGPFASYCAQPLVRLPKGIARRTARAGRRLRPSRPARRPAPSHRVRDIETHALAALEWLCRAQDAVPGGGVARGYSTNDHGPFPAGWQPAYPETTGYIIPTFFDAAKRFDRPDLRDRAIRMARWEIEVQSPDGSIPGGVLGERKGPVVFNTGQVMLGWCRAHEETGDAEYREALARAGEFLLRALDPDGAWRRYSTGDGVNTVHAYDVRVAWALLATHRITGTESFREAAIRNVEFTLKLQEPNGWFRSNDLQPKTDAQPLTHTIAYATRGTLESGMLLGEERYVDAARRTADAVLATLHPDGFLAGRLDRDWAEAVPWCCLTGNAQMAIIWLKLHRLTGEARYREAAILAGRYVRATQDLDSDDGGIRGGIAGPYPFDVGYNRFQMLNWAAKFFVDASLLEESLERP